MSTANALILPINVLDIQESALLRQLLLTHGIQLNLGSANTIPADQILELLEQARIEKTANRPVDIELPDANAQYQELVFKLDSLIKNKFSDNKDLIHGISNDWDIWWVGTGDIEKTETINSISPSVDRDVAAVQNIDTTSHPDTDSVIATPLEPTETLPLAETEQHTNANAKRTIESLLYSDTDASTNLPGPSAVRWKILNVTTRPATAEEIAQYFGSRPDSKTTALPASSASASESHLQALPNAPPQPGTAADQTDNNATAQNNASSQTSGRFQIADAAPAGFEALDGPQNTFIDVYFRDKKVGSTHVTVTVDELTFDEPSSVVALLDDITDVSRIEALLSAPLPTNADQLCYRENDPAGCGYLDVAEVGVIYSESDLRLDLFIASELQTLQDQGRVRYLPPPERNNASILSVYTVASDLAAQEDAIDVSARLLLGNGPVNLTAEADYNSRTDRQRLRELKLTHHFPDYDLVGGTYSYQPGGALSDIALAGASFNSSFKTRVDLEHAFSSELVVFLARRSVVQLAVDDRVYTGDSYGAGNQVLDTRALPDGTYEVEIRVIDPLSGSRSEKRLFTKSTQIPPRGETVFGITAGVPLIYDENDPLPETVDLTVLGASIGRRFNDQSAWRLGLLQFGRDSFVQSEFIYLGESVAAQLTATTGNKNTLATGFRLSYSAQDYSMNFSGEWFRSDIAAIDEPGATLFPGDFRQLSVSLNRSFENFSIGARGSVRDEYEDTDNIDSEQYAVYLRRPVLHRKDLRGFLDLNYQYNNIERLIGVQLNLFIDRDRWTTLAAAELNRNDNDNYGHLFGVNTNLRSDSSASTEWVVGGYAQTTHRGESAGARLAVQHPRFNAGLSSDWAVSDDKDSRNTVATLGAHLGIDRRGAAMGGADFSQAGLIVSVKGEPRGARFDIVLNGLKYSTGEIGSTQFIGLQPFESYSVKLIPQTILSNGIGHDTWEFTLYPGNVQRIDIIAKRKVLLIAAIVDESGELVTQAVVDRSPNPQLIQSDGLFQAEVEPGEVLRATRQDGTACEFSAPDANEKDDVLVVDSPLVCQHIDLE